MIAEAAGLSVPGLYHHYRSKQAILAALVDTAMAEMLANTAAAADDERARRFYERHGFRVESHLPDHYENADGVAMVRQPDSSDAAVPDRN